jgi:DNA-binding NarL/FixJ family response regulator
MEGKEPRVLAAGLERLAFERIAPFLRRDALAVDWVATPEKGVQMAKESRYDVILMDAEPCDWPLSEVVSEMRARGSRSRGAAILVLAEPDQVDAARALKSRGVNRVMLIGDPPQMIGEQMSSLVEVAPRADVRLSTNLATALGNTGRELFCQTENLSMSGMLVRTRHRPQLGTTVVFKVQLGDGAPPVFGRGELVRHTSPAFGQNDGVGIRFLSFAADGAERLEAFLDQELKGQVKSSLVVEETEF